MSASKQRVIADFDLARAHTKASPIESKALYEAGIVESSLRDLPGGDADSEGALQERRSIYGPNRGPYKQAMRFLHDARKLKHPGMSAGELAQAVQRSAFPGRYDQHSTDAERYLGGHAASAPSAGHGGHDAAGSAPHFQAGTSQPDEDAAVIDALLEHHHGGLTKAIMAKLDSGQYTTETPGHWVDGKPAADPATAAPRKGGKYDIKELFWQGPGGIDIKDGAREPQGFVAGHTDHVHVASGPKQVIALGKLAQSMGLKVGENPAFGTVHHVHADGSYHYRKQAIDVTGTVDQMRRYAKRVAALRHGRS